MAHLLLAVTQVLSLLLIPFWPLAIWIQLVALAVFGWWSSYAEIGKIPLLILLALTAIAEVVQLLLAHSVRREGSRRNRLAGALLGGAAGALSSLVFPLVGALFAALLGSLLGSLVSALPLRRRGFGAFLGEAVALTLRSVAAISIAILSVFTGFI